MNALLCPSCSTAITETVTAGRHTCPACDVLFDAHVFPALREESAPEHPAEAALDGEAVCFYHADKKAAASCSRCGRFLCSLCDIDMNGEHVCAHCIESKKEKGAFEMVERTRRLHDNIALAVAVLPFLCFVYPAVLGAPASIFLAIRNWKKPLGLVRKGHGRFVLAVVLSVLELLLFALIAVFIIYAMFDTPAKVK